MSYTCDQTLLLSSACKKWISEDKKYLRKKNQLKYYEYLV